MKGKRINMKSGLPQISFELFPPKSEAAQEQLLLTVQQLMRFHPEYFSVTYGAGGSTQTLTQNTVTQLKNQLGIEVVPHITCIGATKAEITTMLDYYLGIGIKKLVILRGDLPSGYASFQGDFRHATDLVQYIRSSVTQPLTISVAAYPESHPQARDLQTDLIHFKTKVNAGADRAITQYFYNADAYANLLEECQKLQIDIPIIPGIMPITNYEQLARFSNLCGAEIPRWVQKKLEGYKDDLTAIQAFGLEVVTQLCERLIKMGVTELHFYTLNKSKPTMEILRNLGFAERT